MSSFSEEEEETINHASDKVEKADFTSEEMSDITALRSRLQDMNQEGTLAKEYLSEDTTMWRYITAQSQESNPLDKAEEMFRLSCEWRNEIKMIEEIYPEWRGGDMSDTRPRARSARARFGDLVYHGGLLDATCCIEESPQGGPVLLERLGKIDLPGLYNDEYAFNCAQTSYIVNLEEAWNRVRTMGPKVRGMFIMDMTDTGLSMLGYISTIKALTKQGVLRYPEISQRVYLANAGWVLSTLWDAAKPFIPARTLHKVKFIGSSSTDMESLFNDVEGGASSLPNYLGGKLDPEQCPQVCPAISVDDAYGVVLKEILDSYKLEPSDPLLYPDIRQFLNAALVHAKKRSLFSRVGDIEWLLNVAFDS